MKSLRMALLVGVGLMIAGTAQAVEVKKTLSVPASPEASWTALGDFCGVSQWHPAIESCQIEKVGGATFRQLGLKGGGAIREKLLSWSDKTKSYRYSIVEGPLPVADYVSKIRVTMQKDGSSLITWSSHFTAKGVPDAKAQEIIGGVYDAGLTSLKQKLTP